MRKWGWDQYDLREAIRAAHKVSSMRRGKWELFVRKKGEKKIVVAHEAGSNEVFVITGAEG